MKKTYLIILWIISVVASYAQITLWPENDANKAWADYFYGISTDSLEDIILEDELDTPPSYYKFAALNLFYYHLDTHREFLIANLNSAFVEPTDLHADYQYSKILIDNYIKGLFNDQLALIGLDSLARINSDEYRQKDEAIFLLAQAGSFDYWDFVKDQYINKQNYGMWNTYYFYSQDPRYRNEVLERLTEEAEAIPSEELLQIFSKANIVMTIDEPRGIAILTNRFYTTTGKIKLEYFRDLTSIDREGSVERSMYAIINEPIDSIRKEYLPDPNRIHSFYYRHYLKPEFINFLLEQANTLDPSSETYILASRYLYEFTPAMPDSATSTNDLIDNLYNYVDSVSFYNWLGDITFSNELKSIIQSAKTNLLAGDSLACTVQVKAFQDLVDNVYKDSLNTDARFVTIEGWKFLYWNADYILERLPEPPANPNLVVSLKSSTGTLLTTGSLQYYEGSWKDAVNNGDGTFTVITTLPTVSLKMTYEYASLTAEYIPAQNNTYTFQTVNAAVQLKNSLGNLIDAGTVQYYAGAWRTFGTTSNGVAYKELLPLNYSFRMTYEFVSKDKQQNLSTNPVVEFMTVLCTVKVSNTNNQPLNNASALYYAGAWRNIGTTNTEGITTKELLPANISFRATYGNVSQDKQQDISVNSLVEIMLNIL
jgi:hypothetical protein